MHESDAAKDKAVTKMEEAKEQASTESSATQVPAEKKMKALQWRAPSPQEQLEQRRQRRVGERFTVTHFLSSIQYMVDMKFLRDAVSPLQIPKGFCEDGFTARTRVPIFGVFGMVKTSSVRYPGISTRLLYIDAVEEEVARMKAELEMERLKVGGIKDSTTTSTR